MSTVVAQPYKIEGNSGRKIVRLSNGWVVASAHTLGYVHLYVDKNDGQGFVPTSLIFANYYPDFGIASYGNIVYIVGEIYSDYNIGFSAYDVAKDIMVIQQTRLDVINTNTTNGVSLVIDPTNGHLHAAWSCRTTTFSKSSNIRYAKSTDGGASWSAVTQISTQNTTGTDCVSPSIIVKPNGKPSILFAYKYGAIANIIYCNSYNGVAWETASAGKGTEVYLGEPYVQSSPSAVVDKDGVIHVVWINEIASNNQPIYYSKSVDGGVAWSAATNISGPGTWVFVTPSITTDKMGRLFVMTHTTNNYIIFRLAYNQGTSTWVNGAVTAGDGRQSTNAATLYDPSFTAAFGEIPPTIYQTTSSVEYIGASSANNAPTLTLQTENNKTLYENDSFLIDGSALDKDNGNIVNVKYQLNGGQARAITTEISNGTKPIDFSELLTFKDGKLYDGETAITDKLAEGSAHQLKVYAEDDQGGKSAEQIRSFFVVPNRAPAITINPIEKPTGVIDSDKFPISGTCSDPDGNDVIVSYKINTSLATEVYRGKGGDWTFDVDFSSLKVGENIIIVEVIDSHNFKTSKTIKLNKAVKSTPILNSVVRYKIKPPTGSAKGVLLCVQKDKDLNVSAEISMTETGVQEHFVEMPLKSSTPPDSLIAEDVFAFEATEAKDNIYIKLNLSRESDAVDTSIKLIWGSLL